MRGTVVMSVNPCGCLEFAMNSELVAARMLNQHKPYMKSRAMLATGLELF